jgi:hypothetical protein
MDKSALNLKKLQQDLRSVADRLEPLIHNLDRPVSELLRAHRFAVGRSRFSEAGREKIAEANRKLWVVCRRPECNGVRHRKTHPHIKKQDVVS